MNSPHCDQDYEKTYDAKFWSYSKVKAAVPLSNVTVEEDDDAPLRMFMSLLVFAGLATSGGYEVDDDPGHVELVQNVIGRCLEKEDICNEFYTQVLYPRFFRCWIT